VKPWQQYQHDAADVLKQLGFTTRVDDKLIGMSGTVHAVDVSATAVLAGLRLLWVVECKAWKKRVIKEKVAALKTIVDDLGADRGLMLSEEGFQPGARQLALGRNITLSSLADLRDNATEQVRVNAATSHLIGLTNRIVQGLRTFGPGVPHMLQELASRLSADDRAELAGRPDAVDLGQGLAELLSRSGITDVGALLPTGFDIGQMQRRWRDGVDAEAMNMAVVEVEQLTQLLNRAKLGEWPLIYNRPADPKLAYAMSQLLGVVEPALNRLEQQVAEQEQRGS
jgi:hypothetical protein